MPAGKILMVSKVQDELHHLLVSTLKMVRNMGKSQDYFLPYPTANVIYSLRF